VRRGADEVHEIHALTLVEIGVLALVLSVHLFLDWSWQRNVFRRAVLGPVSMRFPASYTQRHENVKYTITEEVAEVHSLLPE